jgi:hypothetical protein
MCTNAPQGSQSGFAQTAGRLTPVLEPGERVLWYGQSRPLRVILSKAAHALFGTTMPVLYLLTPLHSLLSFLFQPFAPDQSISRTVFK